MADTSQSDRDVLETRWRFLASLAIFVIILSGILVGVIIIPVVQGRSNGIDAYTAICRALGILPGSPALRQEFSNSPPTPVSQVIWTPDLLQILANAKPEGVAKKCWRFASHATVSRACRPLLKIHISPGNRAQQFTSN